MHPVASGIWEPEKQMKQPIRILILCAAVAAVGWTGTARAADEERNPRQAAADKYVLQSDRYLHHSKLQRGMKGYGLTVMAGTEIVRFDAEIISVMTRWGSQQDVILARLSGQGLEKSGIIAGMSGSPVYISDGGKDKMIGAVAYGFFAQKEPVCGIQPISQMLALSDLADGAAGGSTPPAAAAQSAASPVSIKALLQPGRLDLDSLLGRKKAAESATDPRLVPLASPLMVPNLCGRSLSSLQRTLSPMGFVAMQAGGVGGRVAEIKAPPITPGAAVCVPLVGGDADWYAVGTVTDVIGDRVLAFGHDFMAEGDVDFPLAAAYVHTIISGVTESFKLTSTLQEVGALKRDESVGIFGRLGAKASMIPMDVTIRWAIENRRQKFHYELCRHPWLTPMAYKGVLEDSALGRFKPPEHHTVRHTVEIDFGKLGKFRSTGISAGSDVSSAESDGVRALVAMLHNPFSESPRVESVSLEMEILAGDATAKILDLQLDGQVYKPGQTVTGGVTLQPFRKDRLRLPVTFELPADLEDGTYTLTACDDVVAMRQLQSEMPQRFDPRDLQQLFDAVQRVVSLKADQLYLRLPLKEGGVALRGGELRDMPASKAGMLSQAQAINTHLFREAVVRSVGTQYVLSGEAAATFQVRKHPRQEPVHP